MQLQLRDGAAYWRRAGTKAGCSAAQTGRLGEKTTRTHSSHVVGTELPLNFLPSSSPVRSTMYKNCARAHVQSTENPMHRAGKPHVAKRKTHVAARPTPTHSGPQRGTCSQQTHFFVSSSSSRLLRLRSPVPYFSSSSACVCVCVSMVPYPATSFAIPMLAIIRATCEPTAVFLR